MTATLARLTARGAGRPGDLARMAEIRNAGREWFTRDTGKVSPDSQGQWWQRFRGRAFVYEDAEGVIVGYGLISPDGWVSLAVHPDHRRRGYGTAIYADLAARGGLRAEVRPDNMASLMAAIKAGFRNAGEGRGVVILTAKRGQA